MPYFRLHKCSRSDSMSIFIQNFMICLQWIDAHRKGIRLRNVFNISLTCFNMLKNYHWDQVTFTLSFNAPRHFTAIQII